MDFNLQNKAVVVVGATGFVGSHLVERLVQEGADVLAIARSTDRLEALASVADQIQFQDLDVLNLPALVEAFYRFRPACVFHLAAQPDARESFDHARRCVEGNVTGTVNVLEASITAGTEVLVLSDSSKVYGNAELPLRAGTAVNPICSYAIAKSASWQICQTLANGSSTRIVSLRPNFIYGPRQNWNLVEHVIDCVEKGRPVELMGGTQTRDPIYITDAVDAFVRAAVREEAANRAIPIGGGAEISVADMCRITLQAMKTVDRTSVGAQPSRSTEIWRTYSDNEDAREILGWSPKVDFATGISLTLQRQKVPQALPLRALKAAV